jgi:hypothetical protein
MKTIHWLFLISVILFISGISFIVAGARTSRRAVPVRAPVAKNAKGVMDFGEAINNSCDACDEKYQRQ